MIEDHLCKWTTFSEEPHDCVFDLTIGLMFFISLMASAFVGYSVVGCRDRFLNIRLSLLLLVFLSSITGIIHYFFLADTRFSATLKYLSLLQLTGMSYLFINLGFRMFRRKDLVMRFGIPLIAVCVALETSVFVYGLTSPNLNCRSTVWTAYSLCEAIVSISFLLCGLLIRNKLAGMPVLHLYRKTKLTQLSSLLLVYLLSGVISFLYHILNQSIPTEKQCDRFFNSDGLNLAIHITVRFVNYILPTWALLIVFYRWQSGQAAPLTPVVINRHHSDSFIVPGGGIRESEPLLSNRIISP